MADLAQHGISFNRPGWLMGARFDLGFIFGITLVGIASALVVVANPALFPLVLFLDIWVLGYHHVIATFTRLCADKASVKENSFLLFWLPPICLVSVYGLVELLGVWALSSLYFYWQWFHYTRQSWGVSQAYRRSEHAVFAESETLSKMVLYSVPVTGILYRMYQAPDSYFGFDLWTPSVPFGLVLISAIASTLVVGYWILGRAKAWIRGELPVAHTLYISSHIAIFLVGYILIEDVTFGWLAINIWHNAQYIMFVWMFNNKRYQNKPEAAKKGTLAHLSQRQHVWKYLAVCLVFSTAIYLVIMKMEPLFALIGLAPMVILYQTVNFHHYIVDSLIWKSKPKAKPASSQA